MIYVLHACLLLALRPFSFPCHPPSFFATERREVFVTLEVWNNTDCSGDPLLQNATAVGNTTCTAEAGSNSTINVITGCSDRDFPSLPKIQDSTCFTKLYIENSTLLVADSSSNNTSNPVDRCVTKSLADVYLQYSQAVSQDEKGEGDGVKQRGKRVGKEEGIDD